MKLRISLLSGILALLTSCNGQDLLQSANSSSSTAPLAGGDSVNALGDNIMVVYQDTKNNYWFGSWESGLYRYDGKTLLHYTTDHGLPHNRIAEIREDKSGILYFNTLEGISRFDGKHFVTLNETAADETGWKLDPDDLWFMCPHYSGTAFRYDGNALYRLKLPKTQTGQAFLSQRTNTWSPYAVYTVYKDSRGNIWFGTAALGACRYDGKSVDWISEEDVTELHNGPSNGVRSILEDKDDRFWFNTLYRYKVYGNPAGNPFYSREPGPGSLDDRKEGGITEYLSIARDNDDVLWFVTYRDGIWRYDGHKKTQYVIKDGDQAITLFSVYKDNNGTLWLGTHKNGAYRFNGKEFERFVL
jgi:ligand-binding sensor domain-containing protein